MKILAQAVGRRKEAIAQVQLLQGSGKFVINNKTAQEYLQFNSCALISVKAPFNCFSSESQGGGVTNPINDNKLRGWGPSPTESPTNIFTGALPLPVSKGGAPSSSFMGNQSQMTLFEKNFEKIDTVVKVKGGGLIGQAEAIKLAIARALCLLKYGGLREASTTEGLHELGAPTLSSNSKKEILPIVLDSNLNKGVTPPQWGGGQPHVEFDVRKPLKTKGFLTQDSRVKERRKYGLKKARKASQYHKR